MRNFLKYVVFALTIMLISCEDKNPVKSNDPITSNELIGIWRRQDLGQTNNGREYATNGQGYVGNFSNGPFERTTTFTWTLESDTTTEVFTNFTYHEVVVEHAPPVLKLSRKEDLETRTFQKQ